jgi:peptide/nickel transport system substrate-binding protein
MFGKSPYPPFLKGEHKGNLTLPPFVKGDRGGFLNYIRQVKDFQPVTSFALEAMSKNFFLKAMAPRLRHLILLLLCISLICSASSCTKTDVTSDKISPQNENILRYDVNAPFTSLNPTKIPGSGSNYIFPLLYSFLFVPNTNGELEPDLAVKWTYDSESFIWTIHLRKDALFHNNKRVTSRDVEYSLESWLTTYSPSLYSLIERILILSDTILSIRLKRSEPDFLKQIWDFEIIPEPSEDKIDYYNRPIGSGPFKFAYRKGEKEVALVANENYYNGRSSLDGVVFYYQPHKEKAWTRLLSGKTDLIQEISPKNYEIMKQYEKKYYSDLYTLPYYTILLYNTNDPLFSDSRVRRALSYAIDKEYIVKNIMGGSGVVAAGPMGVDSQHHNPNVKPIPYDPGKGIMLLNEAGWSYDKVERYLIRDKKCFEFTILLFEEYQIEKKIAQYIKLSLNDIGIKVRLRLLPFEELVRRYRRNNEFQAVITEFTTVHDEPEYLAELWSPYRSNKSRAGCFAHPKVTRLLHQALNEGNASKQKDLFHKVDALISSLQPGTFLFQKLAIDIMTNRFSLSFPFTLDHPGIYRLKYASLNKN